MVHLSSESKQAIVQKVLLRDDSSSMKQLAKTHNIGYSTLKPWVKDYRTGNVSAGQPGKKQAAKDVSLVDKFSHLMATASLDDVKIGSYCRQHGLFRFQLQQCQESFMTNTPVFHICYAALYYAWLSLIYKSHNLVPLQGECHF